MALYLEAYKNANANVFSCGQPFHIPGYQNVSRFNSLLQAVTVKRVGEESVSLGAVNSISSSLIS